MALKPVTGIAPSHWASYLVNGDASGFDYYVTPSNPDAATREIELADKFAAWMGAPIVSCEDYGFASWHDATRFGVLASDCCTYTALVNEPSTNEPEGSAMNTIEHCLCGAPVDVTEQSLRAFTEPHIIRGCKVCKYTGTKPAPIVGAVVITHNSNGGK